MAVALRRVQEGDELSLWEVRRKEIAPQLTACSVWRASPGGHRVTRQGASFMQPAPRGMGL